MEPEINPEEIANFVEAELEKFYDLHKLVQFLGPVILINYDRCELILCSSCTFFDKYTDMLYENFQREEEILKNVKNLCRENFENF